MFIYELEGASKVERYCKECLEKEKERERERERVII
jgi:hypothetical protein